VSERRLRYAVLIMLAAVFASAGCFEKLSGPACTARPFTIDSSSADTIITSTGLRFIDSTAGTGNGVEWCKTVAVHYTGYLLDGTKFDSSRDLGRALIFTPGVGNLIDGFEQGVIGMASCANRRLIIPDSLGFGADTVRNSNGDVIVPPHSTVVFDVEVLEINGQPVVVCDSTGA
jgi:FKBP-type peptidyl-prolyl cis-trans isomerase